MIVENFKKIPGAIRAIMRYLNADSADHYVVITFCSKADDQAESGRIEQIEQVVDELLQSEEISFLRPANITAPRFGEHRRRPFIKLVKKPDNPDSAA